MEADRILERAQAELQEGERLDDLEYKGLRLIQRRDGYCFTSDAVLLANSVRVRKGGAVVDLGTGSGVIALLIAAKTDAGKIWGVELQEEVAQLARRNVRVNGMEDRIGILVGNTADMPRLIGKETADVVVSNPPYFPLQSGQVRENFGAALSRHESVCKLSEWVASAAALLRFGGRLFMIHKCERLAEVMTAMTNADVAPKRVTLIYPKRGKNPDTFLVEGKKGAQAGMTVSELIVYEADGVMSAAAKKIYGKE